MFLKFLLLIDIIGWIVKLFVILFVPKAIQEYVRGCEQPYILFQISTRFIDWFDWLNLTQQVFDSTILQIECGL